MTDLQPSYGFIGRINPPLVNAPQIIGAEHVGARTDLEEEEEENGLNDRLRLFIQPFSI